MLFISKTNLDSSQLAQCVQSKTKLLGVLSLHLEKNKKVNQNSHYIDVIKQMLQGSLTNSESYDVRFTGVKATANYLLLHEKDATVLKHMADLLGPMLTVSKMDIVMNGNAASII